MSSIDQHSDAHESGPTPKPLCSICMVARTAGAKFCPQCGRDLANLAAKAMPASNSSKPSERLGATLSRNASPPPTADPVVTADHAPVQAPLPPPKTCDPGDAATCACGRVLPDDPSFCPGCGIPIKPAPSLGYVLSPVEGSGPPTPLTGTEFIIGKDAGSDLVIPDDEYVSRRHARMRIEDGLVYLEDLGSSNGTLLRIRRAVLLESGDEILIGTRVLRLEKRP